MFLEDGYRELVALLSVQREHNLLDKRSSFSLRRRLVLCSSPAFRNVYLYWSRDSYVDGSIVQVDYFLSCLFKIGIVVVLLHIFHGGIQRNYLCQGEEGGLQYIVYAFSQSYLRRQLSSVNHVKLSVLIIEVSLHGSRYMLCYLLYPCPRAVEKIYASVFKI